MNKSNKPKRQFITLTDFLSGAAGGFSQVIVGQPFDIVKVRQQVSTEKLSPIGIIKNILQNEGPLAFYKGTLSPLLFISFAVAFQFTGLNFGKQLICFIKNIEENNMNKLNLMVAGGIGGLFYSIIISPAELFRIKMQIQNENSKVKYSGSIDALAKIYKSHGVLGWFKGYEATFYREFFGCMFYFGSYEILMQISSKKYNGDRSKVPMAEVLLYGSIAGIILWFLTFPADLIKSKMQGADYGDEKFSSVRKVYLQIVKEQGYKGLYKGLGPCLARAPIANAAIFGSYEKTKNFLNSRKTKTSI